MKKLLLTIIAAITMVCGSNAADLSSLTLTWAQVCSGGMGDEWYGLEEAISVADTLIGVQKTNGGWMKNYQYHKLSATELAEYKALTGEDGRSAHSCFDNYSTTQEMRFLLRVYAATKQQRYLDAFRKALDLIIISGKGKQGGWGQYWPDSGNGSYQDYITFNDDLMTNMMKMLQDVYDAKGNFAGIVDDDMRQTCKAAYDNALRCVLKCQIDDNGVKAAWCAQHDPEDFLPAEGRPHEEPSVSGYESANLLKYLMTIENPSDSLKECIVSAVNWLASHKFKENCYIEDVKDASGATIDRKISEKAGSNVWGRFIQIGGESGKKIYQKFWTKLYNRGKKRAHHDTGFVYYEYQILEESYDTTKAYQPIYSVYNDDYPELFYRHLYNYEDTPDKVDIHGQTIITSLPAANRKSYQYLGSWVDNVIAQFPAWKRKNGIVDPGEASGYIPVSTDAADTPITVASDITLTFLNNTSKGSVKGDGTWTFEDGSAQADQNACELKIELKAAKMMKIHFNGDVPNNKSINMHDASGNGIACIVIATGATVESGKCAATGIAKGDDYGVQYTLPAGTYIFYLGGTKWNFKSAQFDSDMTGVTNVAAKESAVVPVKAVRNGQIVISNDGRQYNAAGAQIK